jgi:hypothetical protein
MDQSQPSPAEATAPPIPAPAPIQIRGGTRITAETAPLFHAKAREARRLRALAAEEAKKAALAPATNGNKLGLDQFTAKRLERVRLQLERVDAMLAEETDPARIDKLCAASSKLEEQERRLSDRSLPPVRRAQDQAPAKLGHGSSLFAAGLDDV